MYLSDAELKKFDEDGYLFFPKMFSSEEASLLKKEADNVYLRQIDLPLWQKEQS